MRLSIPCLALGLLMAAGALSPVRALTTVPRDLDQLVARADAIFRGTALSKQASWKGEGANRHIVTRVTFQVGETLKGAGVAQQTLEFFGGELDGVGMGIADMPVFSVGDEAILFVEGNGKQICPLVGADQGAFRLVHAADSSVARVLAEDGAGLVNVKAIGQPTARGLASKAITADVFRSEIIQRVELQKQGSLRVEE